MKIVLLVDDDRDFVEINRTLLEKAGYKVVCGYNPKEGMDLLKKEKPDLMILDVMMEEPDDGFALAQKIRKEGNKVPIIMLTAISKISGMKFGKDKEMVPVNEFFEKPVAADKLLAAIKKYV